MPRGRARSAQTQLRVGRLTKAHGLKGGLKLELYTDDPDRRFTPGASFALQVPDESPWHGKRIELAELRWYNGHPVGFFAGVTDRTGAESLVKAILWVDQDPDESAEPDAWYDHQLIGLEVVRDGAVVGRIDRLEHLPAQDLLVVDTGDPSTGAGPRREVLVPFVRALVPEVDMEARRVVVTPPEGLFEDLPDEPADPPPEQDDAGSDADSSVDVDVEPAREAAASDEDTTATDAARDEQSHADEAVELVSAAAAGIDTTPGVVEPDAEQEDPDVALGLPPTGLPDAGDPRPGHAPDTATVGD